MSKKEQEHTSPLQKLDYNLLFLLFLFICISCLTIYSAQIIGQYDSNFVVKQLVWYFIGGLAIVGIMILDFDQYRKLSWYLYGVGILLLLGIVIVPIINPASEFVPYINGAQSWYRIGPVSFQPSEIMKVALIISLSNTITTHNETYLTRAIREDFLLLGKIILVSIFPLILVLLQPDLGTSLVFIAIIGCLILVSGIRWRIIFSLIACFVLFITTLVFVYLKFPKFFLEYIPLDPYQLNRFYGWLAPYEYEEYGFHLVKSLHAIGSGTLYGKGFTEGTVYIPEAQTDFIFAIVGEEFGFLGTSIVIALFFLLIYRIIHIALETHEAFGSYLCVGVTGMITFQVFQNVGMTIGLLPITGIPLPFISYGGSSILASLIAFGLILNVSSRTRKFMFD